MKGQNEMLYDNPRFADKLCRDHYVKTNQIYSSQDCTIVIKQLILLFSLNRKTSKHSLMNLVWQSFISLVEMLLAGQFEGSHSEPYGLISPENNSKSISISPNTPITPHQLSPWPKINHARTAWLCLLSMNTGHMHARTHTHTHRKHWFSLLCFSHMPTFPCLKEDIT